MNECYSIETFTPLPCSRFKQYRILFWLITLLLPLTPCFRIIIIIILLKLPPLLLYVYCSVHVVWSVYKTENSLGKRRQQLYLQCDRGGVVK